MNTAYVRSKLKPIISEIYLDEITQALVEVEKILVDELCLSSNEILNTSLKSLISAGGKRIRPILLILCGFAGESKNTALYKAAASAEIIHTASLIHDDVIDGADMRRGVKTIEKKNGKVFAISAGDYLFARAFEIISSLNNPEVTEIFSDVALAMSLGEMDNQYWRRCTGLAREDYYRLIGKKTAALFSASCRLGAILSEANRHDTELLSKYGWHLGLAFQMYDDILDVVGCEKELGKSAGNDLKEGYMTLPYIIAVEELCFEEEIKKVIQGNALEGEVQLLLTRLRQEAVIEKAMREASSQIEKALSYSSKISKDALKVSLIKIGNHVVERYS